MARQPNCPEYKIWQNILSRCLNPKDPAYPDYGGRGIGIAPEWLHFDAFLAAVGSRPSPKLTIDRIDNDRGYEPGNVRWGTWQVQATNRGVGHILTAQAVARLKHEGPQHFRDVRDGGAPGLYLRILASGQKRWVYRYRFGKAVRGPVVIGDVGEMTLAQARHKAHSLRSLIRAGLDPIGEEQRKRAEERRLPTVERFALDEYLERHAKPHKRSWREDERMLRHDVIPAIGDMRLDRVTRRDIALMLDDIRDRGANVKANRVLALVRKMFSVAIERGAVETTPVVGVRATRHEPRARVLTDDELRRLWAATESGGSRMETPTRLAIRLLMLTGARNSEVCEASWGEVDAEAREWTIPGARTKNGREHRVPLSDAAAAVVAEAAALKRDDWLLPSRRQDSHCSIGATLESLQVALGDSVTVHDIRRTVATGLQRLGVRLEVTEAVLNHASGSRAGIVGVYQLHDWANEKRAALDAWATHIRRIVEGGAAGDNVVRLQA